MKSKVTSNRTIVKFISQSSPGILKWFHLESFKGCFILELLFWPTDFASDEIGNFYKCIHESNNREPYKETFKSNSLKIQFWKDLPMKTPKVPPMLPTISGMVTLASLVITKSFGSSKFTLTMVWASAKSEYFISVKVVAIFYPSECEWALSCECVNLDRQDCICLFAVW